jgi:hypothetical protein
MQSKNNVVRFAKNEGSKLIGNVKNMSTVMDNPAVKAAMFVGAPEIAGPAYLAQESIKHAIQSYGKLEKRKR